MSNTTTLDQKRRKNNINYRSTKVRKKSYINPSKLLDILALQRVNINPKLRNITKFPVG